MIKLIKQENIKPNKKILIIGVFHGDEKQGEFFINSYLKNLENIYATKKPEDARDDFDFSFKTINIENGTKFFNHGEVENHFGLIFVRELKIESNPWYSVTIIDNPSMEEFVTSKFSLPFTTSLILSSNF